MFDFFLSVQKILVHEKGNLINITQLLSPLIYFYVFEGENRRADFDQIVKGPLETKCFLITDQNV